MRYVLMGSHNSGKHEFYNYVMNYQAFSTDTKKRKMCEYEIANTKMQLVVLDDDFESQFKKLHPTSAVLCFKYSDEESQKYVLKTIKTIKFLLME